MKCFLITLQRNSHQVKNLVVELGFHNLDVTVFDAVDGRKGMPDTSESEQISQAIAIARRRARLTSPEVGCYLSHYRIIKHSFESGLSHVMVVEDDIFLEPSLGATVEAVSSLPESFEFVRLMTTRRPVRKRVLAISPNHFVCRPTEGVLGTQAYIVNRAGMSKILDYGAVIAEPIDKLYDRFWMTDLKSFYVEPHVVWDRLESSSIKKSREREISLGFFGYLKWKSYKVMQDVRRRVYIARRFAEFRKAEQPKGFIGRAERLRK